MRRIFALVAKDLRRRLADPAALLINLAIPLVLAGTIFLAFGRPGGGAQVPPLRIVFVDLDDTPLSSIISGSSQNPQLTKHLDIRQAQTREEGLQKMRDEEAAALLVIPEGFSDALLGGGQASFEIVKNPAQSIMPIVAQQGAEVAALYLSAAIRILGDDRQRVRNLFEGKGWEDAAGVGAMIAGAYARIQSADDLLFPPIVEFETVKPESGGGTISLFAWMYPGLVVMGVLFVGAIQMKDLLRESESGTLRRLLATPAAPGEILLSKVLASAAVVALVLGILLAAGSLGFGVLWSPLSLLIPAGAVLVLAATGLAALIYAFVRTEQQGDAVSGIVVVLMSLLGGAFVPPQVLPETLRTVSKFTLSHWGNETLRSLSGGAPPEGLWIHMAVLAALGAVTITAGTLLLRRRHLGGAL